jgi:hypothetical protein
MNSKITASALKEMQGKRPDEVVSLRLRITTPLTTEVNLLTAWGGELLYDNGMLALVRIPAGRVNEVAEWEIVLDII